MSDFLLFAIPWAIGGGIALLLWKAFGRFVVKSPLDIVPGPPSKSLTKGNLFELHNKDGWGFMDRLTNDFGQVVKLNGVMGSRLLWVFDPKALQHIVLKDQDLYEEADFVVLTRRLVFGPGLLSTHGEHHRRQRKLLNPVFSIANMREMTPIFYETVLRLRNGISHQLETSSSNEVDLLKWMGRTALELVGKGALGHSFDPLEQNVPNAYGDALKAFMPTLARCLPWRLGAPLVDPFYSLQERYPILKGLISRNFHRLPAKALQDMKHIVDTMDETSRAIFELKQRALMADDEEAKLQFSEGKDLMGVLLRANMQASDEDRLPEKELIAQMSTLTAAGTDTTSNALARILHLLSIHPDVQEKLRREIIAAQSTAGKDDLDYDDLVDLPFLDAVCRETLRLWPPAPFVTREAKRDMVLPLSQPLTSVNGDSVTTITVPKGTNVIVGIYSSNRNKAIWGEDAGEWKPHRWLSGQLPEAVSNARIPGVYSNLMTFLGGGRACIGFKFSQLEMKVVLAILLSSFRFSLPKDDNSKIVWNRAGVAYPSVGSNRNQPSMSLRVGALGK